MRILLYESIPDITRSAFLVRLRKYLRGKGGNVFCLLDDRVYSRLQGGQGDYGIVNCSGPMTHNLVLGNRDTSYVYCPRDEDLKVITSGKRRAFYKKSLRKIKPDRIIVWNGLSSHHEDFMTVLNEVGFADKVFFMEMGWLPQKDYFCCDNLGVNARSSISQNDYSKSLSLERQVLLKQAISNYCKIIPAKKKKLILVPLQIESDSNIIHFSPYKTNQEFITMLEKWIPDGYEVIIRPHPLSVSKIPKWSRADFVLDCSHDLYQTLAVAQLVIGINSTVLIEAMAYGAKVMAFGKVFFSSLGGVSVSEDDRFEKVVGSDLNVDSLLYDLIFNRQISIHSMEGVERHLNWEHKCMPYHASEPFLNKYPLLKVFNGEIRFLAATVAKKLGFLK
ncbi:hypothetical protein [Desulfovibrio gilichinskyi]|uniref:Capsule polysaccharide biosynthesis protein n=1 Tax=Desulfovibrio gilichinskyi TaxID=1519643 RepID=A0A1X7EJR1_9BACT|nr:hypothetical protein [Desulfovibrio gilichinskyi]SMF34674.1 Capsule polysaccharide biosynthesis protein [Desulfovibrio gilichinskyi]